MPKVLVLAGGIMGKNINIPVPHGPSILLEVEMFAYPKL